MDKLKKNYQWFICVDFCQEWSGFILKATPQAVGIDQKTEQQNLELFSWDLPLDNFTKCTVLVFVLHSTFSIVTSTEVAFCNKLS